MMDDPRSRFAVYPKCARYDVAAEAGNAGRWSDAVGVFVLRPLHGKIVATAVSLASLQHL